MAELPTLSFAWTATSGYGQYPSYVNLTGNRLAVRGPEQGATYDRPYVTPGDYVAVELPDEALDGLRAALNARTPERFAAPALSSEEREADAMSLRPLIQSIAEQLAIERRVFVSAPWWHRRKARDDLLVATSYGVQNCLRALAMQFPASAGEAGTAKTTEIGVAGGEHATGEAGDAQPHRENRPMTPEDDELIERVARAIAEARHGLGTWERLNEVEKRDFEHQARAVIEATGIQALSAELARVKEALADGRDALDAMMNTWLDYHDSHGLTQPVTGASNNAFEKALAARDKIAALTPAIQKEQP